MSSGGGLSRESGAIVTVFLPDAFDAADIAVWPLGAQFSLFRARGHKVRVVIRPGALTGLDAAAQLQLRDFALRHDLTLATGSRPQFGNGALLLAAVETARTIGWATRDPAAVMLTAGWGYADAHPIALGPIPSLGEFTAVAPDMLLPPPDAKVQYLTNELDVGIGKFGQAMARLILAMLKDAGLWTGAPLEQIDYQDAYVISPLTARLAIDTSAAISRAAGGGAALFIRSRTPRRQDGRPPRRILHDWDDASIAIETMTQYARRSALEARVEYLPEIPHGRTMNLVFKNGGRARVLLDQGFGAWTVLYGAHDHHPFSANPAAQASAMAQSGVLLRRSGGGETYIVVSRN